eukprot:gene7558-8395_t
MHADHTNGLTSTWRYEIYCSEVTKKLLIHQLGVDEKLVKLLEIGVPRIIYDADENDSFIVTMFDANHCPGSVMFLFEGKFGRIFYTADFRCVENMLETLKTCSVGKIDVAYVNKTFFEESIEFPTREEASQDVVDVIKQHPEYQILIFCHTLGKEDLLVKIATELKEWVIVSNKKMETLRLLELPNVVTTDISDGRIRVCGEREMHNHDIKEWIKSAQTILIFPTGLKNRNTSSYGLFDRIFFIPYSDHSCYSEIKQFLEFLNPDKVLPIVGRPVQECILTTCGKQKQINSNNIRTCIFNQGENKMKENDESFKLSEHEKAKRKFLEKRKSSEILGKRMKLNKGVVFYSENSAGDLEPCCSSGSISPKDNLRNLIIKWLQEANIIKK